MSDTGKQTSPVSRLIRERAMAILRDTRSKIDPKLLDAMKDHLSTVMPPGSIPPARNADMPLSSKKHTDMDKPPKAAAPMAAAAYRQTSTASARPSAPPQENKAFADVMKQEVAPAKKQEDLRNPENPGTKTSHPSAPLDTGSSPSETEPVDRQKIAQIVLEYMKNREEGHKH